MRGDARELRLSRLLAAARLCPVDTGAEIVVQGRGVLKPRRALRRGINDKVDICLVFPLRRCGAGVRRARGVAAALAASALDANSSNRGSHEPAAVLLAVNSPSGTGALRSSDGHIAPEAVTGACACHPTVPGGRDARARRKRAAPVMQRESCHLANSARVCPRSHAPPSLGALAARERTRPATQRCSRLNPRACASACAAALCPALCPSR